MWTDNLQTKYLFYTGKGGVGKTSLACATALSLAERGRRVLIVSTDPASNLDEVLGTPLTPEPMAIPGIDGLFAANLDPEAAAAGYRERAVAPYRGILPASALRSIEEQFSGACTTEIAAFDEFTKLLAGDEIGDQFDHIVFDTAPTGHTLRLLSLPAAWSDFIDTSTSGVSCIGPLSALKGQETLYRESLERLKDGVQTTVVLVARPDEASLKEADRASTELADLGIHNQQLLVNGVFTALHNDDAVAAALEARGQKALASMPTAIAALPSAQVPLLALSVVGREALLALLHPDASIPSASPQSELGDTGDLDALLAEIAENGHGVVMTMGKGGVGKTTFAAAVAVRLAEKGNQVLLTTTDPAAHVRDAVRNAPATLEIARINPAAEVEAYRAEVLALQGADMDEETRAVLEEDLRSPCTEEIAVFRAFARAVHEGAERFVILDTAPTGHTILLLDAAQAYHHEVQRTQSSVPESVQDLLPRLRNPQFTRVFLLALPEPTPVHEAAHLQEDLRRAGIEPFAWVVNQSFAATNTLHPTLAAKAWQEKAVIEEVKTLASRYVVLPWKLMEE